jgi:hypothetical protein
MVLQLFQERKGEGCREAARAHEAAVMAPAGRPGEEEDRARRAGWAGQRPRPTGGWRWWPKRREKESGPIEVEGEVGRGLAESGAGPEFKRISFRISTNFRIWQNFEKLYKEI